jgi:hypothetical protein
MKKLLFLLALIMALTLAACSGDDEEVVDPDDFTWPDMDGTPMYQGQIDTDTGKYWIRNEGYRLAIGDTFSVALGTNSPGGFVPDAVIPPGGVYTFSGANSDTGVSIKNFGTTTIPWTEGTIVGLISPTKEPAEQQAVIEGGIQTTNRVTTADITAQFGVPTEQDSTRLLNNQEEVILFYQETVDGLLHNREFRFIDGRLVQFQYWLPQHSDMLRYKDIR